jgi:CO dehydrogenase/acetyl-CoA synthase alpha subunit
MDKAHIDELIRTCGRCGACRLGSPVRLKAIGAGFFARTGTYNV